MLPLHLCRPGESGCIKKITGRDEIRRHLAELGFVVGESCSVLAQNESGLIVMIKGSRIALNGQTASRIMI